MRSKVLAVIALAGAVFASGCGRYLEASAAVVDGSPISISELNQRAAGLLKGASGDRLTAERKTLVQLIEDRLIEHEAVRRKILIPSADIEQRFQQLRGQFNTEEEFNSALIGQGIAPSSARDVIRRFLVTEQIRKGLVKQPTDAELRTAYGKGEQFQQVHARHILFRIQAGTTAAQALDKAKKALARIRAGEDFATIAKALSEDPGSKASGGDLGTLTKGQTVPQFEAALFALKKGQISEPVQTEFGYHIIQALDIQSKTFAQAKDELTTQLTQQAGQAAFTAFLKQRIAEADIQVNPRYGDFDSSQLDIVDHQFFVPVSPEASVQPAPGLQLPLQPVPEGSTPATAEPAPAP